MVAESLAKLPPAVIWKLGHLCDIFGYIAKEIAKNVVEGDT